MPVILTFGILTCCHRFLHMGYIRIMLFFFLLQAGPLFGDPIDCNALSTAGNSMTRALRGPLRNTLEVNSRKSSEGLSGVFPEFLWNFLPEGPSRTGGVACPWAAMTFWALSSSSRERQRSRKLNLEGIFSIFNPPVVHMIFLET